MACNLGEIGCGKVVVVVSRVEKCRALWARLKHRVESVEEYVEERVNKEIGEWSASPKAD